MFASQISSPNWNHTQDLQTRCSSQKLIFRHKVVKVLVPATEPDGYLDIGRLKNNYYQKCDNYETINIVKKKIKNNKILTGKTPQYSHSFIVKQ